LGMERTAELSHKLESLLDILRRGERTVNEDVISLLIAGNDRIGVLVGELDEHQAEQSAIDDLISRIEDYTTQSKPESSEVDDGEGYDDEYDEELFSIFIEQFKEGLQGLEQEQKGLCSGESADPMLARCSDRLSTLQSSANYMGYDELKSVYSKWSQAVDGLREQLSAGETVDLEAFARDVMTANIEKAKSFFPKVFLAQGKETVQESGEPVSEPEAAVTADESESIMTDNSLLQDFIAEAGEHLEETERNLLRLEQQPGDVDLINEIFRSIHTIKGSSEYLGMERIAMLAHKLESLLDILRRGERSVDDDVTDLLIAGNDRIGLLMGEIEQHQEEQSAIDDLMSRLEMVLRPVEPAIPDVTPEETSPVGAQGAGSFYEEKYDKELFAIFMDQLNTSLQALTIDTEQIRSNEAPESVLEGCVDRLATLSSSANYMEYDELKDVYADWLSQVEKVRQELTAGEVPDLDLFAQDVMAYNIERVKGFFSDMGPVVEPTTEVPTVDSGTTVDDEIEKAAEPIEIFISKDKFETFSLNDLKDEPVIETVDTFDAKADTEQDSSLLAKLESAFDARTDSVEGEQVSLLPDEMESYLLSGEEAAEQSTAIPAQDFSETEEPSDVDDMESLLFSGSPDESMVHPTTAPKPVVESIEKTDAVSLPNREGGERRSNYKIGRRQTDKFRERVLKQSIRVDAAKIDDLMNQVGELVVSRSGFAQLFSEMRELQFALKQSQKLDQREMQLVKALTNKISDATVSLGRVTTELQENVMKVRMLPIAQLFSRYPRLVHDLVKNTDKKVDLEIRGQETELDKMVIEQIADPLVHIIRNAVDHGIEDVDERRRKGKSETGTLRLEAYHESNYVVIEISDDGGGIDAVQIKQRALEKGFVTDEEVEDWSEQELMTLIMRPGFSTAREVTHTSGRGVGMDVVKDNIEKLNGTIDISSTLAAGVTFRIKIPLTLAIIQALLVRVAGELFTIPLSTVDETIRVHQDEISTIEGLEVYYLRDNTVPLIRLDRVFNMKNAETNPDELFVVIVNTGAKQVGLIVDELKGRQEVVIKPLEDYLQEKSGFSGATILGDGSISLILDVYELVYLSLDRHVTETKAATA